MTAVSSSEPLSSFVALSWWHWHRSCCSTNSYQIGASLRTTSQSGCDLSVGRRLCEHHVFFQYVHSSWLIIWSHWNIWWWWWPYKYVINKSQQNNHIYDLLSHSNDMYWLFSCNNVFNPSHCTVCWLQLEPLLQDMYLILTIWQVVYK